MIKVNRTAKPAILVRRATAWKSALLVATTQTDRERITKRYSHSEVRVTLESMFNGKCAYCESKIKHISYTEIEHFKPKSSYPEFTFEWDNLLLACGICNGKQGKSDNFPDATQGGPYIDPCHEDPADHFNFNYDSATGVSSVCKNSPWTNHRV